ncbi:hypothetical protein BC830DRAFT_1114584 [Chytriomyces sp. MP71]|nr:hypothetical protein BC830DRAFT_1114584 [Chytriomyces sp. MP71]
MLTASDDRTRKVSIPPYLESSFDPTRATVSELKGILSECGVVFPTSKALKDDFVRLYREKVVPRAREMAESVAKVRPSAVGIELMKTLPLKNSVPPSFSSSASILVQKEAEARASINMTQFSDSAMNPVSDPSSSFKFFTAKPDADVIFHGSRDSALSGCNRERGPCCTLQVIISSQEGSPSSSGDESESDVDEVSGGSKSKEANDLAPNRFKKLPEAASAFIHAKPQPLPPPPQSPQKLLHPIRKSNSSLSAASSTSSSLKNTFTAPASDIVEVPPPIKPPSPTSPAAKTRTPLSMRGTKLPMPSPPSRPAFFAGAATASKRRYPILDGLPIEDSASLDLLVYKKGKIAGAREAAAAAEAAGTTFQAKSFYAASYPAPASSSSSSATRIGGGGGSSDSVMMSSQSGNVLCMNGDSDNPFVREPAGAGCVSMEETEEVDYSDVLDAYENSPPRAVQGGASKSVAASSPVSERSSNSTPLDAYLSEGGGFVDSKVEGGAAVEEEASNDDEEVDARFSPDPRSQKHRTIGDRLSTSPRSPSAGAGGSGAGSGQPMGSPLLTRTLKQRLHKQVMDTVRRRSSLGAGEIMLGGATGSGSEHDLSFKDVMKAVEATMGGEGNGEREIGEEVLSCDERQERLEMESFEQYLKDDKQRGKDDDYVNKPYKKNKSSALPCIMLLCYALMVPPLFLFIMWYWETGSTIQFCENIVETPKRLADVVTAKELMAYLMPSCVPCPEGTICDGDMVVGCLKESEEFYFPTSKPLRSVFSVKALCEGAVMQYDNERVHGGVSIQQPVYSRTKVPEPTLNPVAGNESKLLKAWIPAAMNATQHAHETLRMRYAQLMRESALLLGEAKWMLRRVLKGLTQEFGSNAQWLHKMYKTYQQENNRVLQIIAKLALKQGECLLLGSAYLLVAVVASAGGTLVYKRQARSRVSKMQEEEMHFAREAAAEVIAKLVERADRIRRASEATSLRHVDTSVRLDQVRDLVLPANAQRQRRWSRGGDVDERAAMGADGADLLAAEIMVNEGRRENVWRLVKEFVLDSGAVEEMEVDGVAVWVCF